MPQLHKQMLANQTYIYYIYVRNNDYCRVGPANRERDFHSRNTSSSKSKLYLYNYMVLYLQ